MKSPKKLCVGSIVFCGSYTSQLTTGRKKS